MTIEEMIQSQKYVDPKLLSALIQQESGGNPKAVGKMTKKGQAQGIMQFMPQTAKQMGIEDPFNPEQAIPAGAKYLSQLIDRFGGDVKKALAAYNAGPEAVEEYGDIPPFEETQNYVTSIMKMSGDQSTSEKGVRTYEGTYNGQKIRIDVPGNIKPTNENLAPLFAAEFNRREAHKPGGPKGGANVQPISNKDPYQFAEKTLEALPGAGSRALSPSNIVSGPFSRGFGSGDEVTPESLQRGMSGEDIPIVGSIIRATKGQFTPEEAADWVISSGQGAVGGGLRGALTRPETSARLSNAFQGARSESGFSRTAAALGSAAGGGVGAKVATATGMPYQVGAYPGMAIGATLGGKVPALVRGFKEGFQSPVVDRIPFAGSFDTEYAPSPTAARSMRPQLQNVADARTQPGPYPMPATPSRQLPPTLPTQPRALPQGPELTGTMPQSGIPLPAPASRVFQMPAARFTNPYQKDPISPETGMSVARQPSLKLYQEGANIPPPPKTGEAEPFNIRKEDVESLGKPYKPALQMSKKGGASEAELSKLAEVLKITPEEVLQKYPHLKEGIPEFEYRGKGEIKVEEPTKEIAKIGKVVLPSTVKEYARVHGLDITSAEKFFRDQGYEIRKRSLKK